MTKRDKWIVGILIAGIILFIALNNIELLTTFMQYLNNLLLPVIIGAVVAFVLSVPVTGFEKMFDKIFRKAKRKPGKNLKHILSIVLTFICLALVIALFALLVIPEMVSTVRSVAALIEENWPSWLAMLEEYDIDTSSIKEWLSTFDIQNLVTKITSSAGTLLGSIANVTTSTVSGISTSLIGVIIAVYILGDWEGLIARCRKMLYAYTKKATADKACYVFTLVRDAYTKFFTGQCVESIILGVLIFISFLIFGLPYAGLIGVVTAICAIIPYVGAFISCALGVVLTLIAAPEKALTCLIVYLVVQFIENQFIYPRVVGSSVGLSPLWTLVAAIVGGNLFGLLGMIFFVPLFAVLYTLLKEDTYSRIAKKKADNEIPKKMDL